MGVVTVDKNTYTVDPLYQWDKDQVLEIRGLSLPRIPEIHFSNDAMDKAIVRQATMDTAGVIRADIPNSLLQKPYKVKAYVCIYEGKSFETLYKLEIPVKARTKPGDYTLEDDEEVYSFNALENLVNNTLIWVNESYNSTIQEVKNTATSAKSDINKTVSTAKTEVDAIKDEAIQEVTELKDEALAEIEGVEMSNAYEYPNSKKGGLRLTKMVGNTVQNGTPTPSTKQPMYHTSDVVEMIQGTLVNGVIQSATNRVNSKNYIPCKSGYVIDITTEELSSTIVLFYYDDNNTYLSYVSGKDYNLNATVPSGATKFKFVVGQETDITPDTVGKITLTINGKYVGCVKSGGGKNLFNPIHMGYSIGSNSNLNANPSYKTSDYIKVEPNVSYYFSKIAGGSYVVPIAKYDSNYNYIGASSVGSEHSSSGVVTFADDTAYIRVVALIGDEAQVEQGTVATDYEPYQETVAYFLTEKPLMADSVLFHENGLFKVEHDMKEVVFNGTESGWQFENNANASTIFIYLNDCDYTGEIMCSHFTQCASNGVAVADRVNHFILYSNKAFQIYLPSGTFTDLASAKEWLANNPITVQYTLAEPTIEVLDTESQLALHGLKTFDNVTYLEVDSRVKPRGIEVEYGTRRSGAYALKSLLNSETNAIRLDELTTALLALSQE